MKESTQAPTLSVAVLDSHHTPIINATVTVTSDDGAGIATGVFDAKTGRYLVPQPVGRYLIVDVHHDQYEAQRKKIETSEQVGLVGFILGEPGSRYVNINGTKIPIRSEPTEIGIVSAVAHTAEGWKRVRDAAHEALGSSEATMSVEKIGSAAESIGKIRFAEHHGGSGRMAHANERGALLRKLRRHPSIGYAGPIVVHESGEVSLLTNILVVKFKAEISRADAEKILAQEHLTIRSYHQFFRTFECEADPSLDIEVSDIADRLLLREEIIEAYVVSAEPPPMDAISPNDFLWPALWDRNLIQAPDAWQLLNNNLSASEKYGDANVIIAVYDGGVKSTGGVPDNEDFRGAVVSSHSTTLSAAIALGVVQLPVASSGSFRPGMVISIGAFGAAGTEERVIKSIPDGTHIEVTAATSNAHALNDQVYGGGQKVYRIYDFAALAANNDNAGGRYGLQYHGVSCASVSTGKADNLLNGRNIGVVGAAPNARLMALQSVGGAESNGLEALAWAVGVDLQSPRPGFPAILDRGADIITCSLGLGAGAALTVDATKALGRIVRRGRSGRGPLLFFSAGNASAHNQNIATYRPYGTHSMTFSCAASTLNQNGVEIKAVYSSYGTVQWCAPSHTRYNQPHNPPTNYNVLAASGIGLGNLPQAAEKIVTLTAAVAATTATSLTAAASIGDLSITVANIATFALNDWIWIGQQGEDNGEWVQISAAPAGNSIPVSALTAAHVFGAEVRHSAPISVTNTAADPNFAVGRWILLGQPGSAGYEPVQIRLIVTPNLQFEVSGPLNAHANASDVIGGANNHHDRFGGTSSATPLTAGTSALLLSAKPTLTWVEVRDIFWNTGRKFDLINIGYPAPGAGDPPQYTGRWQDRAGNFIVDIGGILQLGLGGASTTINIAAGVAVSAVPISIKVASSAGFAVGDAVLLDTQVAPGTEVKRVTSIPDATHIEVDLLSNAHANGVQIAKAGNSLSVAAAVNAVAITVVDATSFKLGQVLQIGAFGDLTAEARLVLGIAGNTITVEALSNAHPASTLVLGGRIAYRSDWYGHGRINAAAAVQAALVYSHDDRDLMIRSFDNDLGVLAVPAGTPISSPDLWIRNVTPAVDAALALPGGYPVAPRGVPDPIYNQKAPHVNPVAAADRWVYARIKNRGAHLESLQAWVRFYIYRHATVATFDITSAWNDTLSINGVAGITSNTSGPFFLAERPLYDAAADANIPALQGGQGGILPGDHFIVKAQWNSADSPTSGLAIANRLRTFIIAEITPHDGVLASGKIGSDSNITYREISFAEITFKQTPVIAFPHSMTVKRAGGDTVQTFRIEINDQVGFFSTNGIELVISRRDAPDPTGALGLETAVTYRWTAAPGSAWQPDIARAWVTADAPKILAGVGVDTAAPSGSNQTGVYVAGSISASKLHDKVTLTIRIKSPEGAIISETTQVLGVQEIAVNYHDLEIKSPDRPDIHFFTDASKIDQTAALAFGPTSDTAFRLTSSFTSDCNGTDAPRVYAAATGLIMVQRILDLTGAADTNKVNVIIKPIRQTALGFTPVKYFIYRGVSLTELLTADGTKVRDKTTANPSAFITGFYDDLQQRIDDFRASQLATSRPALEPDPNPTSIALGWDTSRPSADPLSKYFHDNGAMFQLPLITRGTDFGCFYSASSADEFGFEIVLDGTYEPTLADVRTAKNVIDITSYVATNPPAFDLKRKKEVVLSYLDPATYFGMHWALGVYTREAPATTSSRLKEDVLYNSVIARFATRNSIWLDIRNENGYSFSYYDNYNFPDCQIRIGSTLSTMVSDTYNKLGWPLMLVQRSAADVQTSNGGNLYVSFHTGDNAKPTLYIEAGKPVTKVTNDVFVASGDLLQVGNPWSREVGFKIQTVADTAASATLDVATILKFFVGRGIVATPAWANASVVRTEKFTDNLFGPVDAATIWNVPANAKTEWVSLYDRKVVDGLRRDPDQPFADVLERGVAFQDDQVIFFGAAVGYLQTTGASVPIGKGAVGGFSPKASFLDGAALFDGYEIGSRKITENPAPGVSVDINILTLVPRDGSSLPEGFLLMALKKSMVTDLAAAAATALSPDHQKNLILEEQLPGGGGNFAFAGKNYHRYSVKVRGLDATTFQSADVGLPAGEVLAYSDDGLFFTSAGIDTTLIVPTTYTPDPEEKRAVDESQPATMIAVDSAMVNALDSFVSGVDNNAIPDDASAKAALQTEIENFAVDIWNAAKAYKVSGIPDDRPLYWARLRMLVALKQHRHMLSSKADRDALVKLFEWISRGFTEVSFTGIGVPAGAKKVLITGFDPFQLPRNINQSNPSGVIALALNGEVIPSADNSKNAYVQSVIFPVRYKDFEDGMLDEFFIPYFYGPGKVDLVITMSMNGGENHFDIERFAGRGRSTIVDNLDVKLTIPVGTTPDWAEFFETTLPVAAMMSDVTLGSNQTVYFDQSYSLTKNNGVVVTTPSPADSGTVPNTKQKDLTIDVKTDVKSGDEGSGGNYLSNEIFYRVAHLRDVPPAGQATPSTVPYGHLHVPDLEAKPALLTLDQIIAATRTIIKNALPSL